MSTLEEAARMALEALDWIGCSEEGYDQLIADRDRIKETLRAALAEAEAQAEAKPCCGSRIEKNVPLPARHKALAQYPFASMESGDSFSVSIDEFVRARNAASQYGKRHGMRFVCKNTGDGAGRIWRLE